MSKREKIILAVMLVALSVAAVTFFSGSSPQHTDVANQKELANVKVLSTQLTENVKKDALTDNEKYVLERAEADWPRDPFLERKLMPVSPIAIGASGARPTDFAYSGYVDVGNKRLAIINGLEYLVGDQLESGGYVVKSIDPERVVLEDIDKRGQITIPFTAEIF
jgi:hypothetical protein